MRFLKFISIFLSFCSLSQAFEADHGFEFDHLPGKSSSELRVVWWNILQGGQLGREIEKKEGHDPLQENLQSLLASDAKPEFLILGEYRPNEVKREIDINLRSHYRHAVFIPNSKTYSYQGILILSDLDLKIFTHPLSWVDPLFQESEEKKYRDQWSQIYPSSTNLFDRTFIAIEYTWKGGKRYLLPFHSVQPWMPLKASYPEKYSKYLTAYEILNGETNPLFYQLRQYLAIMKKICHPERNPVLMVGDLNTPDQILGLRTVGYRLLTSSFNDAFEQRDYTFPAPSSLGSTLSPSPSKINEIRIDHVLHSNLIQTKDAIRLPLRGSDHFPIAVTITN